MTVRLSICLVGGIFDMPAAYRRAHAHTPETLLAEQLTALGHDVECAGHRDFTPGNDHDIVHVHHLRRAAYLMAARRTRARFVFTGHYGQLLCGYEKSVLRHWAFRHVLRRCDAAVALSEAEGSFLRALSARRVAVIPNGIHPDYRPNKCTAAADRSGVLYVGQLIPLKGVDVLLRAFARDEVPRYSTLTLVYQNGLLEEPLRSLARELGIDRRVRFLGALPPDRLSELYGSAEVLALPSHAEALPSVVSEALLAGTPVVASRVGGIPDQVGDFGALVEPGDVRGLALALGKVLETPPPEHVRDAARHRARTRCDPEAMARSHVALYESILADGGGPAGGATSRALERAVLRLYPRR